MTDTWVNRFTYSIRPTMESSNLIHYREAGHNLRRGDSSGLYAIKEMSLTFNEVLAFFDGYNGYKFSSDYSTEDLATIKDIVNLTSNRKDNIIELFAFIDDIENKKRAKIESEPRIKSIW